MMRLVALVLALALGVGLKFVVAYEALDYLMPTALSFAESGMGGRAPLEGFGGGALYAAAVIGAFVLTSALAALGAGRERIRQATRTTALLISATAAFAFATFAPAALSPHNAQLVRTGEFNEYPPSRSAGDLRDTSMPLGAIVLLIDVVLTTIIVLRKRPAAPALGTEGISNAAP
ncbi:MAG: hypothetical protein JO036_12980 [Candidatus Eremiobacteraeota bacterium]|nr:hypothetical protein [Candidatus Eremiobacteraeota bacterium]